MRTLVSTFGDGDLETVLLAMRSLPYDRLVLIGEERDDEPEGLAELRKLESMTGNEVLYERVDATGFMGLVEDISELIDRVAGSNGGRDDVVLNISGGTKLLADAALFAAFRLGVPTYHVTERMVRLPVMKGVTAKNRFTQLQSIFISSLEGPRTIADMVGALPPHSKQSLERVMRELKGMGLVSAKLENTKVVVSLTADGHEVRKALVASNGPNAA